MKQRTAAPTSKLEQAGDERSFPSLISPRQAPQVGRRRDARAIAPAEPPLRQDPHALQGSRDSMLEVAIGREVRAFRNKLGITASDLARAAGLSLGMLSKIENGVTSASLTTLQRLSKALGVPSPRCSAASRSAATRCSSQPDKGC